jgi:hypothetical protein
MAKAFSPSKDRSTLINTMAKAFSPSKDRSTLIGIENKLAFAFHNKNRQAVGSSLSVLLRSNKFSVRDGSLTVETYM